MQFVSVVPPKRQPLPDSQPHVVVCEVVCANSEQTINAKLLQLNTKLAHYMADSTSPADSMCPLDIVKRPVRSDSPMSESIELVASINPAQFLELSARPAHIYIC